MHGVERHICPWLMLKVRGLLLWFSVPDLKYTVLGQAMRGEGDRYAKQLAVTSLKIRRVILFFI